MDYLYAENTLYAVDSYWNSTAIAVALWLMNNYLYSWFIPKVKNNKFVN